MSTPRSDAGREALRGVLGDLCGVGVPDRLVEDLDLDVAGVTGVLDGARDGGEVDVPVAHHAAGEQRVGWQRGDPVAYLVGGDPPGLPGPAQLRVELRVPPHV